MQASQGDDRVQDNGKINRFQAWLVLGAATGINMTMGLNYSWSVAKKALVNEWQWNSVEASLPLMTYTAVFAVAMLFGGRMQDRLGPRLIANAGGILLNTGLISCSFTSTPLSMLLAYSMAAIGNGICYATTIPASIKWFPPERKGVATGIVLSGIGLASAYFSPVANRLLADWGISKTFLALGIGVSLAIITLAQFLCNPPADYNPETQLRKPAAPTVRSGNAACDVDWPEMIRTALFSKLWLMYFFAASAGLMIIGHIATIAKAQANWDNGFYLVIILAVFNTCGRLTAGVLSDKYGRRNIMLMFFLLQAANLILFAAYITPALLILGAVMTGLCYGAVTALFPLTVSDFFGVKNFGVNYGLLFLAWGFAGTLGPIMAGYAVDTTDSYIMAYMISAALLITAAILAPTIKTRTARLS